MPLFDIFWSMVMLFLWVAWLWVLFSVISDLFHDPDTSGGMKAVWTLFVVVIPWLGVLVYVLVRGDDMTRRRIERAQAAQDATRSYIRETAGSPSVAEELGKLAELRDAGTITDDEFAAQKATLLA